MTRITLLWAVVFLALAACASTGPQRTRPAAVDADTLAVAALRAWHAEGDPALALDLIARAAAMSPDRPEIAWLHSRVCISTPGCDAAPLETRLRRLSPSNGLAWLGVLGRAQQHGDAPAVEQILEAMSRTEKFDLYWTTLVSRLAKALSAHTATQSVTPLTKALDDTVEWLSKTAVATFQPLAATCTAEKTHTSAEFERCARIARALQLSDTTLVEGLGLGMAQRLAAPGSNAAVSLEQRAATLGYRSRTAGSLLQLSLEREKLSAQLIELMKKLPREQDVTLAILRWAGEPLTPP